MNKKKRMLIGIGLTTLFSQLQLNFLISDFRISCGIIILGIFLYLNRDISGITLGFFTAFSTFFWRVFIFSFLGHIDSETLFGYAPEILFYFSAGVFINFAVQKRKAWNYDWFFLLSILSDFSANVIEVSIRILFLNQSFHPKILTALLFVALVRSSIVMLTLLIIRYQKILVLKEEHDLRYRRLLWLNSFLRTEMFWMESNISRIETVMTSAYKLFEDIRDQRNSHLWADGAVSVAGAVHEVKKDYELVIQGVNDLLETKYQNQSMSFQAILSILEEQIRQDISIRSPNVRFVVSGSSTFETLSHFQIMSIFRNLISNSIDAATLVDRPVTIRLSHWTEGDSHRFQIQDDGPGIEPSQISVIQTPGFSTKINYQTGHINRGLGLSIAYRYVEEIFKGSIKVDSMPNRQTSFDISIPRSEIEANYIKSSGVST